MTALAKPAFDQTAASAFEEKMVGALNGAAMALMTSIGHRTGLFDTMARIAPADSQGIARAAGLNERYVREWLGAMVTSGVVAHDHRLGTYSLPAEHAAFLTRAAAPANMGVAAQFIPLLGSVEDDIVGCFRQGGGVPYSKFGRFHEVMAEESSQTVISALREHILPLVPGLTDRLKAGIRVLDLGCGRGLALAKLAEWFPKSSFVGYDLSEEAVAFGGEEAKRRGLTNLRFEVRDLSTFDRDAEEGAFDLVTTFDAIHDQAKPAALLAGIRRSLAAGGVYLAQDIKGSSHVHQNVEHPLGTLLYTISCLHCMTVSLAQGGAGLGAMWGREKAVEMLAEAGFGSTEVHELEHDVMNYYYVCRP